MADDAKTTQVAVRIDPALLELADSIVADLPKVSIDGFAGKRADVLRAALDRGLHFIRDDVDAKLGTSTKVRKRR